MKIVFLTRRYLPHIGGVELHIQKLIAELGNGFEVTIVTEQDSAAEPLSEQIGRVQVLRIPLPKQQTNKKAIWWWWLRHFSLLLSADVIHVHDVFFWLLPFRYLIFWKKIYITFHGYEGVNNPNYKQKFWHQLAALLTNGNICIGGFHQKWYGVHPDLVSFGAVDRQKLTERSHNKIQKGPARIVFVGRLAADTGILTYLEALKLITKNQSVTLDVFGDGPQRSKAEAYVKKHQLSVKFHGFVHQEKIPWQQYDVAFVSRYLAILESFCAGLPVIAHYNVEIKRDYLQLTPFCDWLVVAHTAEEISDGFDKVHSPQFERTIEAAQAWAEQQTWQKMSETYKKLWQ